MDDCGMNFDDILKISAQAGPKTDEQLGLDVNPFDGGRGSMDILSEGMDIMRHSYDIKDDFNNP